MEQLGKSIIVFGLVLVVVGAVIAFGQKIPWVGRLPGDIAVETPRVKLYFPLATSILVSVVLSAILWLWRR